MPNKQEDKFKVLVPLEKFFWFGDELELSGLSSSFSIKEFMDSSPDLSRFDEMLSEWEKGELGSISHWITIEESPNEAFGLSEKINLFLLALWFVIPTETHVKYKFIIPYDFNVDKTCSRIRYDDQFQWISGHVTDEIKTTHLQKASQYFDVILLIERDSRLWNSLVLTLRGCFATYWQVAFMCFSAAVEGLLTYSKSPGLTKRLAKSFACLTKEEKNERDDVFQTFEYLYNIRSDIMHGRISKLKTSENRLKKLAEFSAILRKLWQVILLDKEIICELQKSDKERESFFKKVEGEYSPPKDNYKKP